MRNLEFRTLIITLVILFSLSNISNGLFSINDLNDNEYNIEINLKNSMYWNLTGSFIYINSDSDWASVAANNDWCYGSGTLNDPYVIENGIIDTNYENDYCIRISNSLTHFIIRNCTFSKANIMGIGLENVLNSQLINNNLSNMEYGVWMHYSEDNFISGNIVNDNRWGISLDGCYNNIISRNKLDDNNDSGIVLGKSDSNIILQNSVNNHHFQGISIENSNNNIISGNIANNNSYQGIFMADSKNNNISRNIIFNNGHGILLSDCNENQILENNLKNNTGDAIWIKGNDNDISGNNISYNNISGIRIETGNNNIISRNNLSYINGDGISLGTCVNTFISGNIFIGNLGDIGEYESVGTIFDMDGDEISDDWEIQYGLNATWDGDGSLDSDADGLTNLEEYKYNTDPTNSDTDGDGLSDNEEVKLYGTDPTDSDTDNDGFSDYDEINKHNTDPLSIISNPISPIIIIIVLSISAISLVLIIRQRIAIKRKKKMNLAKLEAERRKEIIERIRAERELYKSERRRKKNELQNQFPIIIKLIEEKKFILALKEIEILREQAKNLKMIRIHNQSDKLLNLYNKSVLEHNIKRILTYEDQHQKEISKTEMVRDLNFSIDEVSHYLSLLNSPINYDRSEVNIIKLKAEDIIKKFDPPTLYDMIFKLDLEFNTAKKIGKYLIDEGFIKTFLRIPYIVPKTIEKKSQAKEVILFISYSMRDSEMFRIPILSGNLTNYPEINDVLYCEEDAKDDFIKYMNDYIEKCDIFLLFCSENAKNSEFVNMEWRAALSLKKKIIPVFIDEKFIPPLLSSKLGVYFNKNDLKVTINNLYRLIIKLLELPSLKV